MMRLLYRNMALSSFIFNILNPSPLYPSRLTTFFKLFLRFGSHERRMEQKRGGMKKNGLCSMSHCTYVYIRNNGGSDTRQDGTKKEREKKRETMRSG
jgi:hypothetical protein